MRIIPDPNGGRIALQMEDPEQTIITTLLADVSQLLSADLPEPDDDPFLRLVGHLDPDHEVTRPRDPALLRLLPDADSLPDGSGVAGGIFSAGRCITFPARALRSQE